MTIADAMPTCALQITSQTLSTWRAGGLSQEKASGLASHVSECAACQAHLSAYEEIDALLRAQTLPQGLMGNWESLRTRLRERPPHRIPSIHLLANARLIAAVAAMLLVVIGFTLVFHAGIGQRITTAATVTVFPTATPIMPTSTPYPFTYGQPAHPLTWRQLALPNELFDLDIGPGASESNFVVAPSNSSIIYIWAPNETATRDNANIAKKWWLWVSRNAGAGWTRMTSPPVTANGTGHLIVDTVNPNVLLAEVYGFDPPGIEHVTQRFVSRDGGASWQERTFAGKPLVQQMVTLGGATIAEVGDMRDPNGGGLTWGNIPFARSDDGMRTWRAIDLPIVATGQWITHFWVNAKSGAILARTNQAWLWESHDLGAHWTRLPEASSPYVDYIVQDAPSSSLWRICGFVSDGSSAPPTLKCSLDSGRTWIDRTDITISIPCPVCAKGRPGPVEGIPAPFGIASDGAVIIADLGGLTSDYQQITTLYRLEPGATKWQSLGQLPGSGGVLLREHLYQGNVLLMIDLVTKSTYVTTYQ